MKISLPSQGLIGSGGGGGGGDGSDTTAWHNTPDAYTAKSLGTTVDTTLDFYVNNARGVRFRPLIDVDAATKIANVLIGPQTTQSRDVDGASGDFKYILDMQRNHAQSTYVWVGNDTDAAHASAGYVARAKNAEIVMSVISPSDGFADIRAGNDAAIQIGSGCNAFWVLSEGSAPINFAIGGTKYWWIDGSGNLNARGPSYADQTAVIGFIAFDNGVTINGELRLNSKPTILGVASPDGGANAVEISGSHVCVGKAASDSSTGRGLIFEKSDATVFGELFGYNNGTPYIQMYVGGVGGGNICQEWRYESSTRKIGFFGGTAVEQQAAIADASGGAVQDTECRAATNAILAKLRNYALIAT